MSEADGADAALRLPPAACAVLCQDLPRAPHLDAAMQAVERVRRSLLGEGLLTVNLHLQALAGDSAVPAGLADEVVLQRIWSSLPGAYPVAGSKRKTMTAWSRHLLVNAEVFVGEGENALAEVFDDHTLITSLGLRAVVNVPLLDDKGRCFATFNALGTRPHWRPADIWLLRLLGTLATPAVRRAALAHSPGR